jgi:hypothetical protein
MFTTLVLLASLASTPAQPGGLSLTNTRATYGVLGATRQNDKVLPGDVLVLSFDIEGFKVGDSGKVLYSIAMEVADSAGKVLLNQEPNDLEATVTQGATSLPACAKLQIGMDEPPGKYTVKLTVTDRVSKATQQLTRSYEVVPKAFGLVRLTLTSDEQGLAPLGVLAKGGSAWINFAAVGFARDKASGQPDVKVALRVLNDQGRSALAKPPSGEINRDVPDKALAIPMQFELQLNQLGDFSIELVATDKIANDSVTLTYPVKVSNSK